MKKFILLLILSLIGTLCIAQTKFQALSVAFALPDTIQTDTLIWGEWEETEVIMTISDKTIHIYSNLEQEYTVISEKITIITTEFESIEFDALDIFNNRVTIELVHFKDVEHGNQIYITWPNLAICYQIEKL
jgi:hypothetical protein